MAFIMNLIMSFVARWLPAVRAAVTNPRVIIVMLAGAVALVVKFEETRIAAARHRAIVAALAMSNLAAQRDSTRDAAAANQRVARILGDSLRLVEKRVVQIAQRGDVLDQALGRERVARYVDNLTIDSLRGVVHSMSIGVQATESGTGRVSQTVRSAFFNIRQEPYTVVAQVDVPEPPDSAHLELRVVIDPIPIETRVSCSTPDGQGVRAASLSASSPPWATVRFGRVEQSPEVCGSAALTPTAWSRRGLFSKRLVIGAGRALTPGGWRWALFAGAGIGLDL